VIWVAREGRKFLARGLDDPNHVDSVRQISRYAQGEKGVTNRRHCGPVAHMSAATCGWSTEIGKSRISLRSSGLRLLVVCAENNGYAVSLEKRKIYIALRDAAAGKHKMIRILDKSGDDYLYSKAFFRSIALPQAVRRAVLAAKPSGHAAAGSPHERSDMREVKRRYESPGCCFAHPGYGMLNPSSRPQPAQVLPASLHHL
jgi:hypothetical protein